MLQRSHFSEKSAVALFPQPSWLITGTAIGRLSTEWDYSPFKKIILDQYLK